MIKFKATLKNLSIVGLIAVTWILSFRFNDYAFQLLAHSERAHWIFLPAGLRVLAILIYQELGVFGLILGAVWTLPYTQTSDLAYNFVLASTSALAPLLAILLFSRYRKIKPELSGLRVGQFIQISVLTAFANSLLVNLALIIFGRFHDDLEQLLTIFVGDVLGAAILLISTAQIWNFTSVKILKVWKLTSLKIRRLNFKK